MVVTNLHDLIKDPRQAHEPVRHGPGNPRVKMATRVMPSLTKEPVKKMTGTEVEEGSFGDMAKKVGGAVKSAGSKVLDKLGHGSDEELLKKLQKDVGAPAGSQHGKPSMAKPNDDTDIVEDDIEESALQASFGLKKYGKKGMDKLRAAGQKHASEKTMQNIRAEFSDKEKPVTEDGEFAGDYATGEAGQWRNKGPKANKPATIGDLVGEGQDDLDTIKRLVRK